MKLIALIVAIVGGLITIAFTIFPIGNLTIFPAFITIICGFILLKLYNQDHLSTKLPKILITIAFIGALVSMSRAVLNTDEIEDDVKFELREKESKKEAVKELEELEELEGLE